MRSCAKQFLISWNSLFSFEKMEGYCLPTVSVTKIAMVINLKSMKSKPNVATAVTSCWLDVLWLTQKHQKKYCLNDRLNSAGGFLSERLFGSQELHMQLRGQCSSTLLLFLLLLLLYPVVRKVSCILRMVLELVFSNAPAGIEEME